MTEPANTTVLIKIGGSTLSAEDTSLSDVARLQHDGARVIIVHGGGPEITLWLAKLGIQAEFVDGLRVTDAPSLDVATAVLAGLVNKRLVAELSAAGGRALGLSGADGAMMRGHIGQPELGYVASSIEVDRAPIENVLAGGYVPVIAPIAVNVADRHHLLNVNADTAAGAIAVAMEAEKLVFLTDVDGILDGDGQILSEIPVDKAESLVTSGVVKGGMIPKLQACLLAARAGVSAHIVNGTEAGALAHCIDGSATGTTVA
jgi:acetylglutamate kinase